MMKSSPNPLVFRWLPVAYLCLPPAFLPCQTTQAQDGVVAAQRETIDYSADIQPLLATKCAPCHGVLRQEAGLRLDHGQLLRAGGDSGTIIEAAGAETSELIKRVASDDSDYRMPPEGEGERLTDKQIQLLEQWLAQGAPSPAEEPLPVSPDQHWAWQPPKRAALPKPSADSPASNPIDLFVLDRLAAADLRPLPQAEPRTKLRRLYIDLIGLPPTPEEQLEFLNDPTPAAWDATVQRLLDSPAHGERWARHWMDVWRYSDWDGYKDELRGSARHIWHWRDWIVESLNVDKGYDQMILEMLAADEMAPDKPDLLRATGFLARNFHVSNRNIWLDATVEHTAKAFLGLTINCAKCHDHKYDPIRQQEYYAFRAIFEPHEVRTDRVPGEADSKKAGIPRVYDAKPEAATFLFFGGNEKSPDEANPIAPAAPSIVDVPFELAEVPLPNVAVFPALQDFVESEELAKARHEVADAKTAFLKAKSFVSYPLPTPVANLQHQSGDETDSKIGSESPQPSKIQLEIARFTLRSARARLNSLQSRWAADRYKYTHSEASEHYAALKQSAVSAERKSNFLAAKLAALQKQQAFEAASGKEEAAIASAKQELEQANQALGSAEQLHRARIDPTAEDFFYTSVGEAYPSHSTGRRTALARWITDQRNPLTARVAVNHMWMHYFGAPLVENVFDFGMRSPEPVHRELLDWLAVELMEHDWSLKHLHRLIVGSQTYQTASSQADMRLVARNQELDPENKLLWRANVRRLDAEVIRDSLLCVAGNLDAALGGPDIDYEQGEAVFRRSLYFRHAYEKQMEMLVLFDAAGPTECYRRSESIIPQQALALANSPLSIDQARRLAQQLWQSASGPANERPNSQPFENEQTDAACVQRAFSVLFGRDCSPEELQLCLQFLESQSALLSKPKALRTLPGKSEGTTQAASDPIQRARENLIHTLINHNDFIILR